MEGGFWGGEGVVLVVSGEWSVVSRFVRPIAPISHPFLQVKIIGQR